MKLRIGGLLGDRAAPNANQIVVPRLGIEANQRLAPWLMVAIIAAQLRLPDRNAGDTVYHLQLGCGVQGSIKLDRDALRSPRLHSILDDVRAPLMPAIFIGTESAAPVALGDVAGAGEEKHIV